VSDHCIGHGEVPTIGAGMLLPLPSESDIRAPHRICIACCRSTPRDELSRRHPVMHTGVTGCVLSSESL
jgi:hypothetical protein